MLLKLIYNGKQKRVCYTLTQCIMGVQTQVQMSNSKLGVGCKISLNVFSKECTTCLTLFCFKNPAGKKQLPLL